MAKAAIVVLALMQGLWMTFDGTRALTVGDYVTPRTGAYAGQLGPWHRVVAAVGIPPRSVAMKTVFVLFGVTWLTIAVALMRRVASAPTAALVMAVMTLWYLPVGTAASLTQLALLLWLRRAAWKA